MIPGALLRGRGKGSSSSLVQKQTESKQPGLPYLLILELFKLTKEGQLESITMRSAESFLASCRHEQVPHNESSNFERRVALGIKIYSHKYLKQWGLSWVHGIELLSWHHEIFFPPKFLSFREFTSCLLWWVWGPSPNIFLSDSLACY